MTDEKRFAVLIDAENVSEKYIKFILDEISNDGVATIKKDLRRLDKADYDFLEKCITGQFYHPNSAVQLYNRKKRK